MSTRQTSTIYKCFLVVIINLVLFMAVNAGTIEFSTDEGYVDGSLSSQTPDAGYQWKVHTPRYVVDTDDGGVLIGTSATNASCYATRYKKPFPVAEGMPLSLSCDFRVKGLNVTSKPSSSSYRQRIGSIDWGSNPTDVYSGKCGATFGTFEWQPDGTYGFQIFPVGLSGSYPAAALGLTEEGGTISDLLRMSLSVEVPASGNSTFTVKLDNLDGGTNIITSSATVDLTSYTTLYFAVSGGSSKFTPTVWTADSVYFEEPPPEGTVIVVQ